jgi:hypothetical protein
VATIGDVFFNIMPNPRNAIAGLAESAASNQTR